MSKRATVELSQSRRGESRMFQYGYFGHGDIFIATWSGDPGHRPEAEDGISTCFNMAHGNDALALAALVGYLRRSGMSETDVSDYYRSVIEDLGQGHDDYRSRSMEIRRLQTIARGGPLSRFDLDREGETLRALTVPIPSEPGTVERVGGTGMYTSGESTDMRLLLVGLSGESADNLTVTRTAEFSQADILPMGRAICRTVLGEYWLEMQKFILTELGGLSSD